MPNILSKKRYTGIEIGTNQIKMTQCMGNCLYRTETETLPNSYVREGRIVSPDAMSEVIKNMAKKYHFNDKRAAIVLPETDAFTRRMTVPAMTVEQLKLNLPYEFHDYITDDKNEYIYDYSVLELIKDESGTPISMDIVGAAAPKNRLEDYKTMLRRAGFHLDIAAPAVFAFANIIRDYEEREKILEDREYCFVDFGHQTTKLYIFNHDRFEVNREIEYGCAAMDEAIAGTQNVDIHVAHQYMTKNYNDVWASPECTEIYERIRIELMRAINFYSFNNPDSHLQNVYFFGGGSLVTNLVQTVSEGISLTPAPISDLLDHEGELPPESFIAPAAAGITFL